MRRLRQERLFRDFVKTPRRAFRPRRMPVPLFLPREVKHCERFILVPIELFIEFENK